MRFKYIFLAVIVTFLASVAFAAKPPLVCDADNDGYNSISNKCGGDDCNDNNSAVNPGATEACDGVDNDCDGIVDEGCSEPPPVPTRCDQDADGFNATSKSCKGNDCNDSDASININAQEECDGIDNNCNGIIDENCGGGECDLGDSESRACGATDIGECSFGSQEWVCQGGFWIENGDCNGEVGPIGEICDGLDNDCDGTIDNGTTQVTYYADLDSDSYGNILVSQTDCIQPPGFVTDNSDCNDNNSEVYPNATEICDGADNNCDGIIDEGCSSIYPFSMAAAGDSITLAYNADGTDSLFGGQTNEQYEVSWALGDSTRVNSHAQRLSAVNPGFSWDAEYDNYAVSGANIVDLQNQVTQIVQNGPYDYVTIFIGHNDICDASSPAGMLDKATFENRFKTAMNTLYAGDNDPDVIVSSLAKVSDLYNAGKDNSWCNWIWYIGGVCRVVTSGNLDYIAQADQRTRDYNEVLSRNASVYGYTYVPQIYETQFTLDDLSDFDCFHPNVSGQNTIAEKLWNNGLYSE